MLFTLEQITKEGKLRAMGKAIMYYILHLKKAEVVTVGSYFFKRLSVLLNMFKYACLVHWLKHRLDSLSYEKCDNMSLYIFIFIENNMREYIIKALVVTIYLTLYHNFMTSYWDTFFLMITFIMTIIGNFQYFLLNFSH